MMRPALPRSTSRPGGRRTAGLSRTPTSTPSISPASPRDGPATSRSRRASGSPSSPRSSAQSRRTPWRGPYRTQQDAKPEDTTDWGELFAIYTHPDHQGRGAGRALLDVVISELATRGHSTAALWVLRDNSRARDWYAAHGWHEDGATSTWLGAGVPLQEVRLSRRIPTRER